MSDPENTKEAGRPSPGAGEKGGHGRPDKGTFRVVDRRHHASPDGQSPGEHSRAAERESEQAPSTGSPEAHAADEILQLRARVDELARAYARALEDQKECRLRLTRENQRVLAIEKAEVARALIETVDDLDRSLQATDASPLTTGVRVIRDSIVKRLETMGVERMSLAGQPFDPNLSEAVGLVEVADPSLYGGVVEELAAGYRIGDRVVRPAKVRVGRAPPAAA